MAWLQRPACKVRTGAYEPHRLRGGDLRLNKRVLDYWRLKLFTFQYVIENLKIGLLNGNFYYLIDQNIFFSVEEKRVLFRPYQYQFPQG